MASEPIRVSIIVIGFNDRTHICQAIDSALAQSYASCEIIVVDDGSTDGTAQFVADRYKDRVYYRWKENGGMGSAREMGLQLARGEYIQHLDSDDILMPQKIEAQAKYLDEHPEAAFVYGRSLCFHDGDPANTWEHPANARACSGNLLEPILRDGNFVNVVQPLFRRQWIDRVGGWDAEATASDDYDMMARLAYAGAIGHFLAGPPVFMYRHRRSASLADAAAPWRSSEHLIRGELRILGKLRAAMQRDERPELALVKRRIGELEFRLGKLRRQTGHRGEALGHMLLGLRLSRENLARKLVSITLTLVLPTGNRNVGMGTT